MDIWDIEIITHAACAAVGQRERKREDEMWDYKRFGISIATG